MLRSFVLASSSLPPNRRNPSITSKKKENKNQNQQPYLDILEKHRSSSSSKSNDSLLSPSSSVPSPALPPKTNPKPEAKLSPSSDRNLTPNDASASVDIAIVGGGAAGLTAAWHALDPSSDYRPSVLILERNSEAGKKILISGGTRCNVLPYEIDPERDFFTDSPRSALRAALASLPIPSALNFLENPDPLFGLNIELSLEEETNKYFPRSNSAREVRDKLLKGCLGRGAGVRTGASVEGIKRDASSGVFCLTLRGGDKIHAKRVIMAAGGLSYPTLGTDGTGYRLLKELGHSITGPYAALTPLRGRHPGSSGPPSFTDEGLAGVSLDVSMGVRRGGGGGKEGKGRSRLKAAQRTGLLFTHRGFSGPAILDLSHYLVKSLEESGAGAAVAAAATRAPQEPAAGGAGGAGPAAAAAPPSPPVIEVNWTGDSREAWEARLSPLRQGGGAGGAATVFSVLKKSLPQRLAEGLMAEANVPISRQLASLTKAERASLLECLTAFRLDVSGHEGYPKAEVTGGGTPLSELDVSKMESKKMSGLFVCGECADVFGRIGGFNFYWAYVSGRLAGLGARDSLEAEGRGLGGGRGGAAKLGAPIDA